VISVVDKEQFADELDATLRAVKEKGNNRLIAEQVVEENGITKTEFIEFQAEVGNRGITRDEAQQLWQELKDDGVIGEAEQPPPAGRKDRGDVLLVRRGAEASEIATEHLSPLAADGELTILDVESAGSIVEQLSADHKLPLYVHENDGDAEVRFLETLFDRI
jgi:hypothetical protein